MDLRILIVDDCPIMRRIISTLLCSHPGWTVCGEAEDGLAAIQKVQELQPDLVLLDFAMPGINGIETGKHILLADPRVPLILFTVWELESLESAALQAGFRALVRKTEAQTLIPNIEAACTQPPKPNGSMT
jgi:two-component system response regulator AlgR